MEKQCVISLYLDTRRKKANGKYPLKLRVFNSNEQKRKFYPTKFEFTRENFELICDTSKRKYKADRLKLQALEQKANQIADSIDQFTFDSFARKMFKSSQRYSKSVTSYYLQVIEAYKENEQIGTAQSYEYSHKSIKEFFDVEDVSFNAINKESLQAYERHMVNKKESSLTTIGIYLRPLRRIFNLAKQDKIISEDQYPFGSGRYSIPQPKSAKKSLTLEQLSTLFHAEAKTSDQAKAKAFWFFSYACNGMNIKDIAYLKYKNIDSDRLIFTRSKTSRTKRDSAPIVVPLSDYPWGVIDKYGTKPKEANRYIFDIINITDKASTQHNDIKKFVRFVNQHFLKFAKSAGVNEKVSTYWARHSYATNAIRQGASMELVGSSLGHSNMKTTQNYFSGFLFDTKKDLANKLMDL